MSNSKKAKVTNTNKKLKNVSVSTKAKTESKGFKLNEKHEKRLRNLILATAMCSLIIIGSTYAWFIGMKTVSVSPFDVEIAVTQGLSLSLNGSTWSETVSINENNYNDTSVVYAGNTNSWGGNGLVPMSSAGKINKTSSRLTLYKKGSLTVTPGGYRVMAKEIENGGAKELDGYVAFDLFVRNMSGNAYYSERVNIDNEEAIYLTPESEVVVSATGDNEENSGIENSVRVAFAQIGRVKSNSSVNTITGITCSDGGGVLGICDRTAQIWEPNDTKHVKNAINWYKSSCKKRNDGTLTSYSGDCGTINDGTKYPTYVINKDIVDTDNVDAYDGLEYNGYTGSITSGKLYKFPFFTDSDKDLKGTDRPTFMMLAPNSVTKVRVYVYLEGQDIDNYDFASLGKRISVKFGFTKQRFYGEDVDYNKEEPHGPTLPNGLQQRATGTV